MSSESPSEVPLEGETKCLPHLRCPGRPVDGQANEKCVFSRSQIGHPSRKTKGKQTCMWCDVDRLLAATIDTNGKKHINQSLHFFEANSKSIMKKALQRLPPDWVSDYKTLQQTWRAKKISDRAAEAAEAERLRYERSRMHNEDREQVEERELRAAKRWERSGHGLFDDERTRLPTETEKRYRQILNKRKIQKADIEALDEIRAVDQGKLVAYLEGEWKNQAKKIKASKCEDLTAGLFSESVPERVEETHEENKVDLEADDEAQQADEEDEHEESWTTRPVSDQDRIDMEYGPL